VWERPDGKLLDVTPRRDGETDVLFAVSPAHPADFDFLERPNNLRLRAFGYDRHKQSAAWEIAGFNDRRIALEMVKARQKGLTLTQSVMSTLPRNSLEKKIDMFLADAGEMEAMLKPTPEGLVCRDMGRLDEFQNRRLDVDRQRRELYVIADVLLENAMRNGYRPG
jgi:hypothetical protein